MNLEQFIQQLESNWGVAGALLVLAAAAGIGYIIHRIFFGIVKRWSRHTDVPLVDLLDQYLERPLKYLVILIAIVFASSLLDYPFHYAIAHLLTLVLIAATAWLAIRLVALARAVILSHYDIKATDNLLARKVNTQFRIVERILVFTIILFAVAVALLTFEPVREVGVTMLTSAGIIGIIVGFAAQKTLGNLLAGIQIAIAQPIRIDDAVLVEGEFGRVEEINLTFVVVKLWDERRQIVPINYFIEKTFQNWTRVSTELLGTVYFYLDYNAPIEAMRQELQRILAATPLWDRKVSALQVTDVKERTLEIRTLVSASNSGHTFDLRCLVREKMITFLQQQYPECLPRDRVEIHSLPSAGGETSRDENQKPTPARQ